MAASALLKFSQGSVVGGDGEALLGVVNEEVVLHNVDNTGVRSWQIDLVAADAGSSYVPQDAYAFSDNSSTPTTPFTPDWSGSYRWVLKVWDAQNRVGDPTDVDIRVFSIPESNGFIIPPSQVFPLPLPDPRTGADGAKPNELNFNSQVNGWSGNGQDGLLSALVRSVDLTRVWQFASHTLGATPNWLFVFDVAKVLPGYIRVAFEVVVWDEVADTSHAYLNRVSIFRLKTDRTLTHIHAGEVLYGNALPAPVDGATPMNFDPHGVIVQVDSGHYIAAQAVPDPLAPSGLDLTWFANIQLSLIQWY